MRKTLYKVAVRNALFFLGDGGWGVGGVGVLCTTTTGGVLTSLRSEGTLPLALIPNSLGVH